MKMEDIVPVNSMLKELYEEVHAEAQKRKTKAYKEELKFVVHAIRQTCKSTTMITFDREISALLRTDLTQAGFGIDCGWSVNGILNTSIFWS